MRLPEKLLVKIKNEIGGSVSLSKRGVPYLKLSGQKSYSICYFSKNNIFRTWCDPGLITNTKYLDFNTLEEVIDHFQKLGF